MSQKPRQPTPLDTGCLMAVWVPNTTREFPALSGHACALTLSDGQQIVVMAGSAHKVLEACNKIRPHSTNDLSHVRPAVLTHQDNLTLLDDEL